MSNETTKERTDRLLGMSRAELVLHAQDLTYQRDELLTFTLEWLDRQGADENYMTAKARAAIAKVEKSK